MFRALLRSSLLHALVAGLILALLSGRAVETPRAGGPLKVEIVGGSAGGGSPPKGSRLKLEEEAPAPGKPPKFRLEALAPAPPRGGPDPEAGETLTREDVLSGIPAPGAGRGDPRAGAPGTWGRGGRDGFDVAAGMTIEDETRAYPFLEALLRKIDPLIAYPRDFVRERVQGKVTAHFKVDRRGVFVGDFIKVNSEEPLLTAYVLALLAYAYRQPLPERSWGEEGITLVVEVDFKVLPGFTGDRLSEASRFKNLFHVRRASVAEPLLNEEIEKLMRRHLPPVFFLPGVGFYLDFIRAYDLVSNIGSQAESEDRRRRNRIELSRRKWESVIRELAQPVPPLPGQAHEIRPTS